MEVTLNTKNPTNGRLGPTLEGPYEIVKVYDKEAYGLKSMMEQERKITNAGQTMHLKKYYVLRLFIQKKKKQRRMRNEPNNVDRKEMYPTP